LSDATRVRTLGFLFADLRGYTRFIDENGDAAAADLVRDYRALRHAV
jgi:class 3 adenylate cyclase